jgi:glutathione S-transferase
MRKLYHFELCPFSRQVRILLNEKHLEFQSSSEKYWQNNEHFMQLSPASTVPVLKDDKLIVVEWYAILPYLSDAYPEVDFMGTNIEAKNENRRLIFWFNNKFNQEVTRLILAEKVISYYTRNATPRSDVIRLAKSNLYKHLDYMTELLMKRNWLGGETFSLADIVAASHISVLDFLNDIPWQHSKEIKQWYSLVKSRPSFRGLLTDYVQGFNPPEHYTNLDF